MDDTLWKVVLGWFLGLMSSFLMFTMTRDRQRRDTARLLRSEVQWNIQHAEAFPDLTLLKAEKDKQGRPLDLSKATVVPGSFTFSIFDATLERQAQFAPNLLDAVHAFYRLLRQAERFREAAAINDNTPAQRASFIEEFFWSVRDAAGLAREKNLVRELEKASEGPESN